MENEGGTRPKECVPRRIPLKYGLSELTPDPAPPLGRDGKPLRDTGSANARLAVKVIDLLREAEGGTLSVSNAVDVLEIVRQVVLGSHTQTPLKALLPSSDDG